MVGGQAGRIIVASGENAGCLGGYLCIGALWYDRCRYIGSGTLLGA